MYVHVCVCNSSITCVIMLSGLTVGGVWGISEGVQRGAGLSARLRVTAVVNGMTRRGPFMANAFAVLGTRVHVLGTMYIFGKVSAYQTGSHPTRNRDRVVYIHIGVSVNNLDCKICLP